MNFRDQAIVISKKLINEHSYIITVFTHKHGIYSGVLKQYNNKMHNSLSEGNLIDFFWRARLHQHIGTAKAELIKALNIPIMMDKTKLYAFNAIISLIKISFYEREPHNNLFPKLYNFIKNLKYEFSFSEYIKLELSILSETGYKLQLDRCVVTNSSENLAYVSPKSGCAVSQNVGKKYESKLLRLPKFLTQTKVNVSDKISQQEKTDAFNLTSYFFKRYILVNKAQPESHLQFISHIKKQ